MRIMTSNEEEKTDKNLVEMTADHINIVHLRVRQKHRGLKYNNSTTIQLYSKTNQQNKGQITYLPQISIDMNYIQGIDSRKEANRKHTWRTRILQEDVITF